MENTLDAHPKGPKAGYVPIERLNRTEYAASVKALVGVDVKAKDVLPQDIQVDGFDNIAAALSVSPAFLDQYISAARHVAKLAIGDPDRPYGEREVHYRGRSKTPTTRSPWARAAACGSSTISRPMASIASASTTLEWVCTPAPWRTRALW